jgi:hypothetical protein
MITTKEHTYQTETAIAEILFSVETDNHGNLESAEVEVVELTGALTNEFRQWREEMIDSIVEAIQIEIDSEVNSDYETAEQQIKRELLGVALAL